MYTFTFHLEELLQLLSENEPFHYIDCRTPQRIKLFDELVDHCDNGVLFKAIVVDRIHMSRTLGSRLIFYPYDNWLKELEKMEETRKYYTPDPEVLLNLKKQKLELLLDKSNKQTDKLRRIREAIAAKNYTLAAKIGEEK